MYPEWVTMSAIHAIGALAQHLGVSAEYIEEAVHPDAVSVMLALAVAEQEQTAAEAERLAKSKAKR